MWNYMGNMGWGNGWGILGMTHMVLWWVLLVLGIVVLVKWLFGRGSEPTVSLHRRALEVLAERYARGEINKDEFDAKRRDLNG
jgi:putative membrane protein